MAATASQLNEFNAVLEQLCFEPEKVDYARFNTLMREMRAAGAGRGNGPKYLRINVRLRPEWELGQRLQAAYAAAKAEYPGLPDIEWQGKKDQPHAGEDTIPAGIEVGVTQPATGNPFADKLAALLG